MTASMSEQLSVAPLLRHFFQDIILAEPSLQDLHEAGRSAVLVCEVLETLPGERWDEERGLNEMGYIVPGAGGFGEVMNNSWC